MNMAEDTSSWQSAARAAEKCQNLNQLHDKEDLKVRGGGQRLMANANLNVQFLEYSLMLPYHRQCSKCLFTWFNFAHKHQLVLQSTSSCSNYLNRIHRLKQARLFDEFS